MPNRLVFSPASYVDIPLIRDLADRIWRASYADLLTDAQVGYMLGWMYAPERIAAEIEQGVTWIIAALEDRPVGYLSVSAPHEGVAELHKLYLLSDHQGAGLGQEMLRHAQHLAWSAGAKTLRLRVNKGNARALRSYARAGFRVMDALVADIGGGFVMDDFVLTRSIGPAPLVKICGISTPETLEAAITAGADQIGLVFFPKSPRNVSLDHARGLADQARRRTDIVALTVDASDEEIEALMAAVRPDWIQLHGRETPERAADVRRRTGRPVMKAAGIGSPSDVTALEIYRDRADRLLLDAKPPAGAARPGGNGIAFDWAILDDVLHPFMLSGGLSPANVAEAVGIARPFAVDVSSGVESSPGKKDPELIAAFVAAAKRL